MCMTSVKITQKIVLFNCCGMLKVQMQNLTVQEAEKGFCYIL